MKTCTKCARLDAFLKKEDSIFWIYLEAQYATILNKKI